MMKSLTPVDPLTLSKEEMLRVLEYLMFLKEKRNKKLKARGYADGRKQRLHIGKENPSSNRVILELTFITGAIEAKDKRDIAIIDIPRAFLQTYIDEIVHAVMREKLVGTLLAVNKEKSPNLSGTRKR